MALMQAIAPISRRPLHEETVDRLRDLIVHGDLAPGERLNERVLCERLKISRTPLREAIKLLATEGLVELLPNRGAIVSRLEPAALAQTFEIMGALESLAGELACRRAPAARIAEIRALHDRMVARHRRGDLAGYFRYNQAIHMEIVEASGNPKLSAIYRQLNANVRRVRYMANLSQARWDAAVREHTAIIVALEARNSRELKALLQDHLAQKLAAVTAAIPKAA
jgi:DNA-binding GntR family transcriptional regulator